MNDPDYIKFEFLMTGTDAELKAPRGNPATASAVFPSCSGHITVHWGGLVLRNKRLTTSDPGRLQSAVGPLALRLSGSTSTGAH